MQFVCVSENFQNGYLYISDTGIPASEFGGYGSLDYMLSNPYQAFVGTFADCFSITGQALMPIDADGALAYAAIMSKEEVLAYRGQIEGDYITRTVENGQLVVVHEDGSTSLVAPTMICCFARLLCSVLQMPVPRIQSIGQWEMSRK